MKTWKLPTIGFIYQEFFCPNSQVIRFWNNVHWKIVVSPLSCGNFNLLSKSSPFLLQFRSNRSLKLRYFPRYSTILFIRRWTQHKANPKIIECSSCYPRKLFSLSGKKLNLRRKMNRLCDLCKEYTDEPIWEDHKARFLSKKIVVLKIKQKK